MLCDKIGCGIFKVSYFIGKFLGLVALEYDFKGKVFRTSVPATVMSSVICIFVAAISPFVVQWNSEIYHVSGAQIDQTLSLIAAAQLGIGYATSIIVLLCQLWRRKRVSRSANDFRKVFIQLTTEMGCGNIITPGIIILIAMKFSITMYEVFISFPYLIEFGDVIPPERIATFFLNLYIAEIAAVFSDITFAALLLFARYFRLMDELVESLKMELQAGCGGGGGGGGTTQKRANRQKLFRLIRLYLQMKRMFAEFTECVEISILVQTLHSSANMLSNLYALLDCLANEKYLDTKALVYNVMIFVNICLLIHAAEWVKQSSAALKDTLMDLDASQGRKGSRRRRDVLVFEIWPEVLELDVLGMFALNNMFLLFLISYVSNFVVIILQFQLNRI